MTVIPRLLSLCVLVLALPALAAKDPLAQGTEDHEAQIIGWSADEKRFAVRLYLRDAAHQERKDNEIIACEGYVTHEEHPLRGGMVLLAYERGRLLSTFPIYDNTRCTPPDVSKKRLEDAKKKLSGLGINLDTPGRELIPLFNGPTVNVGEGPRAPYSLEYEKRLQDKAVNAKTGEERGTVEQELYLRKGEARQKLLARKSTYAYSTRMNGYWEPGLGRVFVSPSGQTLVVLGHEILGNLAKRRKSLRLLGVLGWSGDALKPL
ncbi:MAG TPA: hypothetical protein VK539_04390 [Myxococcaceae bacterium]|nr:hypothetical protein [Myxococcaceae bacterium]